MALSSNMRVGPYEILAPLGSGGMGEVYLAEDTRLDRKVAIKFLPAESIADEQAKRRLVREAKAAAALDHPNICSIYEVAEDDGRGFIVMQYVEGETLAARIQRKPLELRESLDIAMQIADALAEAHAHNIIHRDIKPQNIMLTARVQAKVLDFVDPVEEKLVRAVDDRRITSCGLSSYAYDCRLMPDEFKVFSPVRYTNVQARVTLQRRHYERGIGRGCYTE